MKKLSLICLICIAATLRGLGSNIDSFAKHFTIIPKPQKVTMLNGRGIEAGNIKTIYIQQQASKPILPGLLSNLQTVTSAGTATISLIISKIPGVASPEGYVLTIQNEKVNIAANNKKGLFYGLQTLNQLMQDANDQSIDIPACRITDYPAIACRALHLDMKSHLDTGDYYYRLIDRLAEVKVNTLLIEFEDKLKYVKADKVGGPLALPVQYFAALSKYAHERNIEIDPLVQGLGHASFILKHEAYKSLRDDPASDYVFDPLNPKTYELQFSMYEDAIAATPYGKFLHVGGDEVGDVGKSALAKKSGMKPIELQMYWLKKVTQFAIAHHRIPIFWDDMVFKLAGLYQTTYDPQVPAAEVKALWEKNRQFLNQNTTLFPAGCLYARWNYDAPGIPGNIEALNWYVSHHLGVMPATAAQESWMMMPRNRSNIQAIKEYCHLAAQRKIDNILCTTWDDSSPHFETFWRGIYDFAWFSWNDSTVDEQTVHSAFRSRFYSNKLQPDSSEFQDYLEDALNFWDTAFVTGSDRENYRDTFPLIDLPDTTHPGSWSSTYATRIANAEKQLANDSLVAARIGSALTVAGRNKYALEIMQAINALQSYSPALLVLLQRFDMAAGKPLRDEIFQQIHNRVDSFQLLRRRFDKTLGATRTLEHPAGFVTDSNARKHWADSGSGTDWMCYIELQMNKKVEAWLSRGQQ